jgi:hypothetical protein
LFGWYLFARDPLMRCRTPAGRLLSELMRTRETVEMDTSA